MKKLKKAQNGAITKFVEGQIENVDTVSIQDYLNAKNAYISGKKLSGNKVYDNWDKYNYVRQYFEQNPKATSATIGTTYDKYGNRWDDQILEGFGKPESSGKKVYQDIAPMGENTLQDRMIYKYKKGGIINDDMGQLNHPGKITKINSNKITMKGVNTPLIGISDSGDVQYMEPGKDYKFKGNSVIEYPIAQEGGIFENIGTSLLNNANNIVGGFGMLKQQKLQRQGLKQGRKLSDLTRQVSELDPEIQPRKYVRPEDNILDTNALIPTYGTGSNFLAKDGKTIKADWGTTLEQLNEKNVPSILGSYIGGGTGKVSGESMIGKGVGSTIGSVFGPLGGAVGGTLGSLAGGIIGAEDQREQLENERKINQNLTIAAFNQGNRNSPFMKNGGDLFEKYVNPELNMKMGGELQTLWGGKAETISNNPHLPGTGETVMFKGNSHSTTENGKSGIGITYGDIPVEVEGGEPAVKTKENNLTIFGNMKIPNCGVSELQDPKAKGKKFKNYVADLSLIEEKQNKILDKSVVELDKPIKNQFDKLRFNSAKNMIKGADMNLKEIASKKQIASRIQDAILQTAEENNLDSDALAKGKIKKTKSNNTAQDGKILRAEVDNYLKNNKGWEIDPENENRLRLHTVIPGSQKLTSSSTKGSDEFNKWFKENYNENTKGKILDSKWGPKLMVLAGDTKTITPDTDKWEYKDIYDITAGNPDLTIKGKPNLSYKIPVPDYKDPNSNSNFNWMDVFNSAIPYFRPSNQSPLDPNQLSGEMFALSNNQLEPVQAQKYNPLLEQATDISLQDQLNANQADFNSIQRLAANNPAALSALAAQKYAANSKVLADQFRINQQQKLSTYNKNREVLNDATLKNLAILDQQYTRQAQAKSNTKAVAQSALNSIADKIAKNKLENRTLGIYENLYNYRYLPNGQAINMNPLAKWNTQGDNLPILDDEGNEYSLEETKETDGKGMPTKYRIKKKTKVESNKNGSIIKSLKRY